MNIKKFGKTKHNVEKKFDVYGIGNPLIDVLSRVEDKILESLNIDKGIMTLVGIEKQKEILNAIPETTIALGGSCANTIISAADFGLKTVYGGAIGNDEFGDKFEESMTKLGVTTMLKKKTLPTGSSVILISPDAERSQNTYLGACQEYSVGDVKDEKIKQSKILYFTGYMWDTQNQKTALKHAMKIAKDSGTKIYFDVADPFVVNRFKDDFIDIIKNDSEFVLANMEEAKTLTGNETKDGVLEEMMKLTNSGVVKNGKEGSYIFNDRNVIYVPIFEVEAVDTTGAGDIYAAGMIFGLIKGYELEKVGRIASFASAKVVEKIGARLDYSLRDKVDTL